MSELLLAHLLLRCSGAHHRIPRLLLTRLYGNRAVDAGRTHRLLVGRRHHRRARLSGMRLVYEMRRRVTWRMMAWASGWGLQTLLIHRVWRLGWSGGWPRYRRR